MHDAAFQYQYFFFSFPFSFPFSFSECQPNRSLQYWTHGGGRKIIHTFWTHTRGRRHIKNLTTSETSTAGNRRGGEYIPQRDTLPDGNYRTDYSFVRMHSSMPITSSMHAITSAYTYACMHAPGTSLWMHTNMHR